MPFSIGDVAIVKTLGRKRGKVVAVGRNGRYQLRVEGMTMWCRAEDLAAPVEARKKGNGARPERPARPEPDRDVAPPGRVDLHGLVVDEAVARMVQEIDQSLLRGADRVEVVHGKGSGRIKNAVQRQLASMPVVAAFRLDPKNEGVTWVHFR